MFPPTRSMRRHQRLGVQGKAEDYQKRVAGLLGAPVRNDPGLPAAAGAGDTAPTEQLAAEAIAVQPQSAARPVAAGERTAGAGEPANVPAVAAPSRCPQRLLPPRRVDSSRRRSPAGHPAPSRPHLPKRPLRRQSGLVAAPSHAAKPVAWLRRCCRPPRCRAAHGPRRAARGQAVRLRKRQRTSSSSARFASAQGARRAWGILAARNPALRNYRMTITPAVVRGKQLLARRRCRLRCQRRERAVLVGQGPRRGLLCLCRHRAPACRRSAGAARAARRMARRR